MSDTGRKTGQTKQELQEQLTDLENFLLWIKENHNENWKQYLQQYLTSLSNCITVKHNNNNEGK